jgi:NADH:ubiquinone oxidoreductase subunit 2 (subunit N)
MLVLATGRAGTMLVARAAAMLVLILIQTATATAAMFVLTATHKKQDFLAVKFTILWR